MTDLLEVSTEQTGLERERKRLDAIWWAGAFLWTGLTLGAYNLELLPEIADSAEWWPWIFIGLGPWSLLLNLYRLNADVPRPTAWDWIWTIVFLGVAVGVFVDVTSGTIGAAILIAVGLVVLYRALTPNE